MVLARIQVKNKKELEKVFKLEDILKKKGIAFDTAYDVPNKVREWQMDWSLEVDGKQVFKK